MTAEIPKQEIKAFYCYAREDKALREELEIHLSSLKRQYHLTTWSDHEILPGEDFEKAIDTHLSTSDLVLLLISPHFLNSDYCYSREMSQALERHQKGFCCVIPILLHPTYWEEAPFSSIQLLPTDAKAITSWPDRYEAFHDVTKGIRNAIKNILYSRKNKEQWLQEGEFLSNLKRYEEALNAYQQAIRLSPNDATVYNGLANSFFSLKRYEEALNAYRQAIHLGFSDVTVYSNMSLTLHTLEQYQEISQERKKLVNERENLLLIQEQIQKNINQQVQQLYQIERKRLRSRWTAGLTLISISLFTLMFF